MTKIVSFPAVYISEDTFKGEISAVINNLQILEKEVKTSPDDLLTITYSRNYCCDESDNGVVDWRLNLTHVETDEESRARLLKEEEEKRTKAANAQKKRVANAQKKKVASQEQERALYEKLKKKFGDT